MFVQGLHFLLKGVTLLEITVHGGCLLSVCQHITAPAGRATFTLALPFYKVTLFNIGQGEFRSVVHREL